MHKLSKISVIRFSMIFIAALLTSTNAQTNFKAIGIEGGWYVPSLSFWNDETFVNSWDEQFMGGIYGRGFIEIELVKNVSSRIGLGYWTQTLTQKNIPWESETRTDELQLTLIPLTMDLVAYLDMKELKPILIYGGIGWGMNFIQLKYSRTPSVSASTVYEKSGKDYIGYLLAGFDLPIASGFGTAIEFRYVFGEYIQQAVGPSEYIYDSKVSLGGPQITLALKYLFDN